MRVRNVSVERSDWDYRKLLHNCTGFGYVRWNVLNTCLPAELPFKFKRLLLWHWQRDTVWLLQQFVGLFIYDGVFTIWFGGVFLNLIDWLTDWLHGSQSFLRSQQVLSLSRNFAHFIEPEGSLPRSQEPATSPYPEQDRSNPFPPSHFSKIHFNIILPSTPGPSKWCPSLRFTHKNTVYTSLLPHTCYMFYPISFFLIWSPVWYLVRSTEHEAHRYVVFSTPLLSRPSQAQISSSAPYSQTPSACVPPAMWETKFHTRIKQQATL